MPQFQTVTSRDNPLMKRIISLQGSRKARRESGLFVLEGLRICKDAAANNIRFLHLILTEAFVDKFSSDAALLQQSAEVVVQVPQSLFAKIADTDSPQGVLAVCAMPQKNAIPAADGRYIGLENLADPTNLGAVSRTAEALGLSGIVLTESSCDAYSPKALRASMGTLLRVPLYFCTDICAFAKQYGLRTIACVVDADAVPISAVSFHKGDLLVIGNEANGLTPAVKAAADICVTIPMAGSAESLNAAAAAAIAMWEMVR